MGNFLISDELTGIAEGGYANSKKDRGGETMWGIARNFWPYWKGWSKIDKYKADWQRLSLSDKRKWPIAKWINASAKVPQEGMDALRTQFYKLNFWNPLNLDLFRDQALCNTVYDFGVNSGTENAADTLQDAYNNIRPKGARMIKNDSDIGPETLKAIHSVNPKTLYDEYNRLRRNFYISIAKDDQADWLKGWLRRLKPYKQY